jgi:hypothetical protein
MKLYNTSLFYCYYARFIWGLTHITCSILLPHTIQHMFGSSWTNQARGKLKRQLLAGASAFCWAIWLTRNDVVFDKSPIKSFIQVLYRGTHWHHYWSLLEKHDQDKESINLECRKLEMVAMQIYADHRWRFSNRICA